MQNSLYYARLAKRRIWWLLMSTSVKRQTKLRQLEEIVSEHYQSQLFRNPTPVELHFWVDGLAFGGMPLDYFQQKIKSQAFPPEALVFRIGGSESYEVYEHIGRTVAKNLTDTLSEFSPLKRGSRILDFGCGCARVLRYFQPDFEKCKFYGSDIDQQAIAWCQEHITDATFVVNNHLPPLPFEDQHFDFIYSISIFTHLPEEMQFAWLKELRRVTKIGGHLILTTHGQDLFPPTLEAQKPLSADGFFYYRNGTTEGLPEYYQTAWHTEEYVREQWGRFFKIRKHKKQGINNHQDLILCQRVS